MWDRWRACGGGATCAVQVSFAPTQPGTRTGTLSLTTSAAPLPLTVSLTGAGAQSHLQISPASLNFGSQVIGAPAALSLTLLNNGANPITAIALAVSGDYSISTPCAVAMLAPGGSCSVTLTFSPTVAGIRTGALTLASSDIASPTSVPLTGIGNTISNGTFTLTASGSSSATCLPSPAAHQPHST